MSIFSKEEELNAHQNVKVDDLDYEGDLSCGIRCDFYQKL